jgi:hypothetical protein
LLHFNATSEYTLRGKSFCYLPHLSFIQSYLTMFIPTLIIPLEYILDQVYHQHIILTIFLLILAILARITNEAFTIVDHIFLCEIDECI